MEHAFLRSEFRARITTRRLEHRIGGFTERTGGSRRKQPKHTYVLEREQWLPRPMDEVFSFFSRPENLPVITPPWLDLRMVEAPQALLAGSLIRYRRAGAGCRSGGRPRSASGVLLINLWTAKSAVRTRCGITSIGSWRGMKAPRCGTGSHMRCPSPGWDAGLIGLP
jgi:hypothetical protein